MVAVLKPWSVMVTVMLVLLACLGALVDAYPSLPEDIGKEAPPEELSSSPKNQEPSVTMVKLKKPTRVPKEPYHWIGKREVPEALFSKLFSNDMENLPARSQQEGTYQW